MSTIVASNLSDGTTSIPTNTVVNGSAKAWANLNGTGTIALRDSFNVASITDNGTGDYTASFTAAMVDADYAFNACGEKLTDNAVSGGSRNAPTASAYRCRFLNPTSFTDVDFVAATVHGDLA